MKLKNLITALSGVVESRNISEEIVIDALKEALAKALRREIGINDAFVDVIIDPDTEEIKLYQCFDIVEEVEDDALQVEYSELENKEDYQIGQQYRVEFPIQDLGRSAAQLAKQVLKQKIREAEKQALYDEYIEKKYELVVGTIDSVEERFVLINLGKGLAMMPKTQQIPGEVYKEGQLIRVVVIEVSKDTKGAQIIVSRSDAHLVKRLFEKEVSEIFDGSVEIKAIARDAGERTKIAVYSNNPQIDPIGACIGNRGSRVQAIIDELKNEKIDIFEWSENPITLLKNALAPAVISAVFRLPDQKGLTVVVEDKQLSLAIGKNGRNAKLAVKLTKQKIDIKSMSQAKEKEWDIYGLMLQLEEEIKVKLAEKEQEKLLKQQQEIIDAENVINEVILENENINDVDIVQNEDISMNIISECEPINENMEKEVEPIVNEEKVKEEPVVESKPKLTIRQRQEYVSKFEELADASKPKVVDNKKKKKKFNRDEDDDIKRINNVELLNKLGYSLKPIYTDDELADLDYDDDNDWDDDIDYDDFDDYYED